MWRTSFALYSVLFISAPMSSAAGGDQSSTPAANSIAISISIVHDANNNGTRDAGDVPLSGSSIFLVDVPVQSRAGFVAVIRNTASPTAELRAPSGLYELSVQGPRYLPGEESAFDRGEVCHGWRITYITGAEIPAISSGREGGDIGQVVRITPSTINAARADPIEVGISHFADPKSRPHTELICPPFDGPIDAFPGAGVGVASDAWRSWSIAAWLMATGAGLATLFGLRRWK